MMRKATLMIILIVGSVGSAGMALADEPSHSIGESDGFIEHYGTPRSVHEPECSHILAWVDGRQIKIYLPKNATTEQIKAIVRTFDERISWSHRVVFLNDGATDISKDAEPKNQ